MSTDFVMDDNNTKLWLLFFITDNNKRDHFFSCQQRIGVFYDTFVIVWGELKVTIDNNENITRLKTASDRK